MQSDFRPAAFEGARVAVRRGHLGGDLLPALARPQAHRLRRRPGPEGLQADRLRRGQDAHPALGIGLQVTNSIWCRGGMIPYFVGIGIGIGITNQLDSKSGLGSSSRTITLQYMLQFHFF